MPPFGGTGFLRPLGVFPLLFLLHVTQSAFRGAQGRRFRAAIKRKIATIPQARSAPIISRKSPAFARLRSISGGIGSWTAGIWAAIRKSPQVQAATLLAEQAERQTQLLLRLKLATETAGISIWEQDLVTGDFIADDSLWTLFGLSPSEKFDPRLVIHDDEREKAAAAILAVLVDPSSEAMLPVRHRSANPRPEPQYVQTHMRVYRDAAGAATRLMGVVFGGRPKGRPLSFACNRSAVVFGVNLDDSFPSYISTHISALSRRE